MEIYIVNIVLIGIYSLAYNLLKSKVSNEKILKKFMFGLVIFQMLLILMLRSNNVGVDLKNYEKFFNNVSVYGFDYLKTNRFEWGYKILVYVITLITKNYHVFICVVACISIIPIGIIVYKYSTMPFLSMYIYITLNFYAFTFSGLRQAIAISCVFVAFHYIIEKKFWKFVLFVLLATLFHKSAIVFFFAYIFKFLEFNKKTIIKIVALSIFLFIFREIIFQFFADSLYNDYTIQIVQAGKWFLFSIILTIFCLLYRKSILKENENNKILYFLTSVGCVLMIFTLIGTNALRISNYFYIFITILIPKVIQKIKDRKTGLLVSFGLIIGLFLIYYNISLKPTNYQIVPYEFYNKQ